LFGGKDEGRAEKSCCFPSVGAGRNCPGLPSVLRNELKRGEKGDSANHRCPGGTKKESTGAMRDFLKKGPGIGVVVSKQDPHQKRKREERGATKKSSKAILSDYKSAVRKLPKKWKNTRTTQKKRSKRMVAGKLKSFRRRRGKWKPIGTTILSGGELNLAEKKGGKEDPPSGTPSNARHEK